MSSLARNVSRNLQCPVCLELLSDPKQLSCTHTFCKKCLKYILACSSQTTANSLTCPMCRSITDVRGGNVMNLNTNVPLKSLVDDVQNGQEVCEMCDANAIDIRFCCECGKYICNTCLEIHNNWRPHLTHRVVSVEDIRDGKVVLGNEVYCQEHASERKKHVCTDVCLTCKKFICLRCRMLNHEKKGHTVQSAEEYNASTETEIESLQARGETKAKTINNHQTCIESQKKRVTDHIDGKKAEINEICQESIKKLNERRAVLGNHLETQKVKLCQRLDEMKDFDERLVTSIESASVLAGNSLKAPLEGDAIVIRDSLSGDLKNVLGRDDPLEKVATDVADRAEQLIFTPNNQRDQLNIGEVQFVNCELKYNVELPKKFSMSCMLPIDEDMIVGSSTGIGIFSADSQLCGKAVSDEGILDIGFLSKGQMVYRDTSNIITLFKQIVDNDSVKGSDDDDDEDEDNDGNDENNIDDNDDGSSDVVGNVDVDENDDQDDEDNDDGDGDGDGDKNIDELFEQDYNVDVETLSTDEGGIGGITVDSNDLIYVSYRKAKKIQVFSPAGGDAIREIPCDGYAPQQITSYNNSLIIQTGNTIRVIDYEGKVKHMVEKFGARAYATVTQRNSILIAWVNHEDGLVSIDAYTNELIHVKTLISDQKIENSEKRNWYYLQEFRSGEIAFCTPGRLYIFKLTITNNHAEL